MYTPENECPASFPLRGCGGLRVKYFHADSVGFSAQTWPKTPLPEYRG